MAAVQSKISYLLSQAFSFPEADLTESGLTGALIELARDLGFSDTPDIKIPMDAAQAEYTRLFVNAPTGVPAPPYSSVYISGARILMQQGLEEAMKYYREAGVQPETGSEPADHISIELAFVGRLLETENIELLNRFLKGHLLLWYPHFLKRLLEAGPHPFYEMVARVTWQFLKNLSQEDSYEQTTVS